MDDIEVEILEGFGKDAKLRKMWFNMWQKLGARIVKMPKWMQTIVLQDINTAIENRLAVLEIIQQTRKKCRDA